MLTLIFLPYSVEKEKEERKNRDGNGEIARIQDVVRANHRQHR